MYRLRLRLINNIKNSAIDLFSSLPSAIRFKIVKDRLWILREIKRNDNSHYSIDAYHEKKAIFFHIPKCAGISLSEALFSSRGAGHIKVNSAKIVFGLNNFHSYFKFTIVRNPWDRFVSAYHFLEKGGLDRSITPWIVKNIIQPGSFKNFVHHVRHNPHLLGEDQHLIPQYKFITDGTGKLHVDYIGRFESIEEDFRHICGVLKVNGSLPHKNNSIRKDYRQYYDRETIDIIKNLYVNDIKLLGYAF